MMAIRKKIQELQSADIEALLPWYAAGALGARDARRVDAAVARDPGLARQYAAIRREHAETIRLNENLGVPSPRVIQKLFAAIDAESTEPFDARPRRKPSSSSSAAARLRSLLIGLSPRAIAWSTALAILGSMLLGGATGALLMKYEGALHF
jgi:anti-sigma factor RsiW